MADIFDEVNDEIKQEKLENFWKENGTFIIVSVICVILAVGAKSWWVNHKAEQNASRTEALISTLAQEDSSELQALAAQMKGDHKALAQFLAAGLTAEEATTDTELAAAALEYEAIAGESSFEDYYRDLAALLAVGVKAQMEDPDFDALVTEIAPLTTEDSIYRASALELKANLLGAQEKYGEAITAINTLLDMEGYVPAALLSRAEMLKDFYELQATPAQAEKNIEG